MLRISRIVNDSAKPMLRNKRGSAWRGGLRGTVLLLGLLSACHPMFWERHQSRKTQMLPAAEREHPVFACLPPEWGEVAGTEHFGVLLAQPRAPG